jgi:hypothetical protein
MCWVWSYYCFRRSDSETALPNTSVNLAYSGRTVVQSDRAAAPSRRVAAGMRAAWADAGARRRPVRAGDAAWLAEPVALPLKPEITGPEAPPPSRDARP